jgi:hypothetical protein
LLPLQTYIRPSKINCDYYRFVEWESWPDPSVAFDK